MLWGKEGKGWEEKESILKRVKVLSKGDETVLETYNNFAECS